MHLKQEFIESNYDIREIMNLSIRKINEGDLDSLFALLSDPNVMRYLEQPYTKEKTAQFMQRAGMSEPPLIYVVENDKRFIGYVIYHDYDESAVEIGWVLYPECWGRGYASHLTKELIKRAFLSQKDVVIECSPQQEATKHIAEKYGFDYLGNIDGLDVFSLKNKNIISKRFSMAR